MILSSGYLADEAAMQEAAHAANALDAASAGSHLNINIQTDPPATSSMMETPTLDPTVMTLFTSPKEQVANEQKEGEAEAGGDKDESIELGEENNPVAVVYPSREGDGPKSLWIPTEGPTRPPSFFCGGYAMTSSCAQLRPSSNDQICRSSPCLAPRGLFMVS